MAENKFGQNPLFDEPQSDEGTVGSSSEEGSVVYSRARFNERLKEHEIREIELETDTNRRNEEEMSEREAKCESKECMLNMTGKFAFYLCFVCNIYFCDACGRIHDILHDFVRVESEENERKRMNETLLERMMRERMSDREFYTENVKVCGRVNVKHELDKEDCWISGLCELQDKRWVVLDRLNYCMKIFSSVTNTLLRYVRLGSEPWNVTEIKQEFTDPNSASGSKSGVSGAARGDQDKHCLLAVTFPWIEQIWFIDVNQTPATKTKTIKMQKKCFNIDFSEDKIFTLCWGNVGFRSHHSVDILSAEGNPYKVIQLDFRPNLWISDLAVNKHKIYLTDNIKVLCINVEDGKTISELPIEGFPGLRGICVDPSNNVFVCGWNNNKVYKLSPDLREFESLNLDTEFIQKPFRICFTGGKLFVGHFVWPLRNTVNVVQLT